MVRSNEEILLVTDTYKIASLRSQNRIVFTCNI